MCIVGVSTTISPLDQDLKQYTLASYDTLSEHQATDNSSQEIRRREASNFQLLLYVSVFVDGTNNSLVSLDWLPNHLLIIHILLLFAVLNPLVIPFGLLYFCVETGTSRFYFIQFGTDALLVSCDKEPGTIVEAQVFCSIYVTGPV